MLANGNPWVQSRRLHAELRQARQASKLTQEQVAGVLDWSLSKIVRIEAGSRGISANDLTALLRLYNITEPEQVNSLLALAQTASERSWWTPYRDVAPSSLLQLIEYESAASVVRQVETIFIPGILQTADYARAVLHDYYREGPGSDKVRALVELRVRREDLLDAENSPAFRFMLDEAVVRRPVGSSSIMRRQLRRLIEVVAERPNIAVELIPFSAGLYPGLKGPFEIIEFADPADRDIVFLESPRGDVISDDPAETAGYQAAFEELWGQSRRRRDSLARLAMIADEMT